MTVGLPYYTSSANFDDRFIYKKKFWSHNIAKIMIDYIHIEYNRIKF